MLPKLQTDHLEEDIGTLEGFKAVYDHTLQRPDEQLCSLLYGVMKASMRSHSRRPSSSEVSLYMILHIILGTQ